MNIVYVYADVKAQWDRSERRCAIPARALNRTGRHSAALISRSDFTSSAIAGAGPAHDACHTADLIVIQGSLSGRTLKAVQSWRARDKAIIADIDRAEHLKNSGADPTTLRVGLKLVHAATLPSRRLAADYQELAPVFHLPTYLEPQQYLAERRAPDDRVVIGWRGGDTHLEAFLHSGVAEALRSVCLQRPQAHAFLCTSDERLKDILRLPEEQVTWQPWVPFAEWPQLLASFDIGIAPLDGAYDQRRCWSQPLEYMLQRMPWVASAGGAFQELSQFGWLVKNQPQAWERVLLDIIDHLDDYRSEAEQDAYLFAISQSIDENVDKIAHIYTQIASHAANRYDALNGSSGARLF